MRKLTAGSGYDYLTRSVCCDDATGRAGQGLASYYAERGDLPGRFVGRGIAGIDGIDICDRVTADHMKALFGVGMHPLAIERNRAFDAAPLGRGPTVRERIAATHLGRPFPVYNSSPSEFAIEVQRQFQAYNKSIGAPCDAAVPAHIRVDIRSRVARDFFIGEHDREPIDARELSAMIAKLTRPPATAVAGYDVTFSPVKSVSTLWAVADAALAARIEIAHNKAVADALSWLEDHALFTREGPGGARQVDVTGLVATAFTHRDSRAGDPDLHTHVAIANKVQTHAGRWLSIDGRVLYKALVSISETYNTALEKHLTELTSVRFAEREGTDPRKRPVREIVGVDPALNQRFSKRRVLIEGRRDELARKFHADHGRHPTPGEAIELAQQATLETREAKHEPRTITQQRAAWTQEAVEVLGSKEAVDQMVRHALTAAPAPSIEVDQDWLDQTAAAITHTLESSRAVWQYWHVYAEAQRQVRILDLAPDDVTRTVEALTQKVLADHSIGLARPEDPVREPDALRRNDGTSVYRVAGSDLFTTNEILAAERRLVDAAGQNDGSALTTGQVGVGLLEAAANGLTLNTGQADLVRQMATSGARVQLAIAPAGSGKTTAMRALAIAWKQGGGAVYGLAPSAVAAEELHHQLLESRPGSAERSADTIAKLVHGINTGHLPEWANAIGPQSLLVIDEAGMADTLSLDTVVRFALDRGASVRLIGDDQQLAAIGAGGVLRDIQSAHGAIRLDELMRFTNPVEGAASLALRQGRPHALGFYLDNDRVHVGDTSSMVDAVFEAWRRDRDQGFTSLMLAPTRDLVTQLNQRAREHRLSTIPDAAKQPSVQLADGIHASVGDLVITRLNDRRLMTTASDWVKNGDRWRILTIKNGGVQVQHQTTGSTAYLPPDYVAANLDLGYACTIHTAQGVTADITHGLLTGTESRQQLYTMASRGRRENHLYLAIASEGDPHDVIDPNAVRPPTATEVLESILARDGAAKSATTQQREALEARRQLFEATQAYTDAVYFAAEQVLGPERVQHLEDELEQLHPGISAAHAWPALRSHLILLGTDINPLLAVEMASERGDLRSAVDIAAVLDRRVRDLCEEPDPSRRPLPWTPAITDRLAADPEWGDYLSARKAHVEDLARQVAAEATSQNPPEWARGQRLDPDLIGSILIWRAGNGVPDDDLRPTGPAAANSPAAEWQRKLDRRLAQAQDPVAQQWRSLLLDRVPEIGRDAFATNLAERLAVMSRTGVHVHVALEHAIGYGPLPDDHVAAALWWRLQDQVGDGGLRQVEASERIGTCASARSAERWAVEAAVVDPRLPSDPGWPLLAELFHEIHECGYDIPALLRQVTRSAPLGGQPVEELIGRVCATIEPGVLSRREASPVALRSRMTSNDVYPSINSPGIGLSGPSH